MYQSMKRACSSLRQNKRHSCTSRELYILLRTCYRVRALIFCDSSRGNGSSGSILSRAKWAVHYTGVLISVALVHPAAVCNLQVNTGTFGKSVICCFTLQPLLLNWQPWNRVHKTSSLWPGMFVPKPQLRCVGKLVKSSTFVLHTFQMSRCLKWALPGL